MCDGCVLGTTCCIYVSVEEGILTNHDTPHTNNVCIDRNICTKMKLGSCERTGWLTQINGGLRVLGDKELKARENLCLSYVMYMSSLHLSVTYQLDIAFTP